ncbi:MAG TPA: NAD-binding protein [Patescibacteria group bacterium]|nr:NAD-binding protein [Patescibacteria group bacterium]
MLLKRAKLLLTALVAVMLMGVTGFVLLEDMSLLDATYLTVATIATVGYGDVVPRTVAGKIFAMVLIIGGVGLVYYSLTMFISMIIEGGMKDVFGRQGMNRRVGRMQNHIIVCGAGRVGTNAIRRLQQENELFVVVESDQERFNLLLEEKIPCHFGDATFDEVLLAAGLMRSKGVITALSHDADNVYVTLTAKSLNPSVHIVARAERPEAEGKLRRAGADTVIFPSVMGGRQLVTAMTKPVITDLMENVFYNEDLHLDMAQIAIKQGSSLVGQTLEESRIKEHFDSIVVAIKRGENLVSNPRAGEIIEIDDIIIVLGQRNRLSELGKLAKP